MNYLYCDDNAHVAMSKKAIEAFVEFQNSTAGAGNPSAPNVSGQMAANYLETARCKIAALLGAFSNQIVFTSTASEAACWGMQIFASKCNKLYYSPFEHSCIKDSIDNKNIKKYILNNNNGIVDFNGINDGGVVCMAVQNETGVIQPLQHLPDGFILFSDLSQAPGLIPINLKDSNINIAIFSSHKFGGSAGLGILYLKDSSWWQEYGSGNRYYQDRSGTPDVAAIVASATALEETLFNMPENMARCKEFQSVLEDKLTDMGLTVVCKDSPRVPSTTFVYIPNIAMHILLDLSKEGIIVGLGSACNSLHTGASPSIRALRGFEEAGPHDFIRISQKGKYAKKEALIIADHIYKGLKRYAKI